MFKEFQEFAEYEIKAVRAEDAALREEEQRIKQRLDEIHEMRSNFVIDEKALASYISACTLNRCTCPVCFIRHSAAFEMQPVPSDGRNDLYRCPHCDTSIEVENRAGAV